MRKAPLVACLLSATLSTGGLVGCRPDPRREALILLARGNMAEGVVALERLRDAQPSDPTRWIDLGHGYELLHRYDAARASYERAMEIAPADPRGPRELGLRALAWGDVILARHALEEAVRRGDEQPETYHGLGLVRLAAKDLRGARSAYLAGLTTPRGGEDGSCVLGLATVAVAEDRPEEALRWYDELARRRPSHAAAHIGRAWALWRLGRYPVARAALDAARSLGATERDVAPLRARITADEEEGCAPHGRFARCHRAVGPRAQP